MTKTRFAAGVVVLAVVPAASLLNGFDAEGEQF